MASVREQALSRIAAALTAAAPGGANVYRARETSLTRAITPAIVIMPQGNAQARVATNVDKHQLDVNLEIFVRGDPWDSLADPVDVAAHAVLMNDAALWAIVADVRRISESFDSIEADRTSGTLTVGYRLTYQTRAGDISVAA